MKTNQFGIKSLFVLMVATAFTIVICQSLAGMSEEVFVLSLVMSSVSALIGVAMLGLSILFACGIAVSDVNPRLRKINLWQCFHMFVMGLVALGPSVLLLAAAILTGR